MARVVQMRTAKSLVIQFEDRRTAPVYSVEEAAGYLGIPIATLRAWSTGRPMAKRDGRYAPVLEHVDPQTHRLSFYDLVEAHLLRAAIERDVPLKQLKRGLSYLRAKHPDNPRPLLTYNFMTDGKYLLVGGMLENTDDRDALLNASLSGQGEMTPLLEPHLITLLKSFDEYFGLVGRDRARMPNTIFPKDGKKIVSITSGVYSGRPVIEGTRIPTAIIAQRFQAGEAVATLAREYRLPKEKIEAAIKYEEAA